MGIFLLIVFVVLPLVAVILVVASRGSEMRAVELQARAAQEKLQREQPGSPLAQLGPNEFVQSYMAAFQQRARSANRRLFSRFAVTFVATAVLIPVLTQVLRPVFGGREAPSMAVVLGLLFFFAGVVWAVVGWRRKLREDVLSHQGH
ncbi:MAG: hypothetical protein U0S76_14490 [Pseudoxanthomonas sp.]|nr:hypothetical protein [Pseudoxanthomonas sp.]